MELSGSLTQVHWAIIRKPPYIAHPPIPARAGLSAGYRRDAGVGRRPSGSGVVRSGHCRRGSSERLAHRRGHFHQVLCRVGSSEKRQGRAHGRPPVHCRTGSSEMGCFAFCCVSDVHCRIGSSEMVHHVQRVPAKVHCRVGSQARPAGLFLCQAGAHGGHARLLASQLGQRVL